MDFISIRNTTRAAIVIVLAVASVPVWAAAEELAVLPHTTTVTYTMHDDVDGPDGAKHVERVTITNRGGADYPTTIAMGDDSPSIVQLTLGSGDLRATDPPANSDSDNDHVRHVMATVGALDILFGATQNATEPISMGSQWQSTVHLILPGGDVATIPLAVTAQSVRGTDVRLVGSGAGAGTVRGKGHTLKAQVAVDAIAEFRAGRLISATVTRTITGHVFIKTISFEDTWTVTS